MKRNERKRDVRSFTPDHQSRLALVEAADVLSKLVEKRRDPGFSVRAWSLARKLEGARFRVVLVGGQKRGKSTLVNVLVGTRLLPAGVVPLTSVATTVCYGEKPCARLHLTDGKIQEVDVREELKEGRQILVKCIGREGKRSSCRARPFCGRMATKLMPPPQIQIRETARSERPGLRRGAPCDPIVVLKIFRHSLDHLKENGTQSDY